LVGDFGGEDGTKSLKICSKLSTQARVSASEKGREVRFWRSPRLTKKGREVRVWRPPRLTLERELCVWRPLRLTEKEREVRVWRPPRLTLKREVCVSWRSLSLKPYRLKTDGSVICKLQ